MIGRSPTCTAIAAGASIRCRRPGHDEGGRVTRGLTHLAITDHDRIDVALRGAGAGAGRVDGHRRGGGQDARWRPDLRVPRAGHPAGVVGGGDDRGGHGSRVGWSASRIRSTGMRGSLLRDATMAQPGAAGRLGRDAQRAVVGHGNEDAAGVRAASTGCPGSRCPTRIRSWRSGSPTPRSTAIRRRRPGCSRRSPTAEIVPGRATFFVRLWTPFAKRVNRAAWQRPRRPSAGRPAGSAGPGRLSSDRWPRRTGPSADGRRDGRVGRVRARWRPHPPLDPTADPAPTPSR